MSSHQKPSFINLIKEPLLHFLLGGFLLFIWFEKCHSNQDDYVIEIQQEDLTNLMQYRSKAFDKKRFEQKIHQLSETQKQALIQDYIEEEVLYREAQRLGLDQNDYVIKRRMIQKMEFLYADEQERLDIPEDSLMMYYQNHPDQFAQAATYTFTHIFKNKKAPNAEAELMKIKGLEIPFTKATKYGDRFLYQRNYVARDLAFVEQHFGTAFAEKIDSLPTNDLEWQGPFASEHGWHLVLLTQNTPAQIQPFELAKEAVKSDYEQAWKNKMRAEKLRSTIDQYTIRYLDQ